MIRWTAKKSIVLRFVDKYQDGGYGEALEDSAKLLINKNIE